MKSINFSAYIVTYNFIIGVLVMIASQRLGVYAGVITRARNGRTGRLVQVGARTFGACVAAISGVVYLWNYVLKMS